MSRYARRAARRYAPPAPPVAAPQPVTEEIVYVPVPKSKLTAVYAVLAEGLTYDVEAAR